MQASDVVTRLQESLVRGQAGLVLLARRGRSGKLHVQRRGDGCRDLVLHGEYILHLTVVTLRPEMAAVGRRDQLRADANAITDAAHASFENRRHTQRFGYLADVDLFASERESRSPCDYLQPWNLRQQVDDLLGQ